MKAVQIEKYGGPDVLEVRTDVATPTPSDGQVLVQVHAASINPFDIALREGRAHAYAPLTFPAILGGDFAGTVTKLDGIVTEFAVGDEVYGQALIINGGSGSFAEFAAAKIDNIAKKPQNIDFIQAASLPLVGCSAVQALEEHIQLHKGPSSAQSSSRLWPASKASAGKQKILIHGGAGGIGSIAIQLAKALGAYVATTVSVDDVDFVRSLGADEVIDYKTQQFAELLHDFDAVFVTGGKDIVDVSFITLKRGGVIVSMLGKPNDALAEKYGVTAIGQNSRVTTDRLNRLTQYIESGKIKPRVDKIFSLNQVKEAFVYQGQSSHRGKVVLQAV